MKKINLFLIIFILSIVLIITFYFIFKNEKQNNESELSKNKKIEQNINNDKKEINTNEIENNINVENEEVEVDVEEDGVKNDNEKLLIEPIAEFKTRITKKPFGIYITPQNSQVQPEKFQGYHTGADVEYEDALDEVEVKSIADGRIVLSRRVSGYGGVVIISHNINGENILSLYGHLDPKSLVGLDSEVRKGDRIGILGEGGSSETDFERKHLHLGIIKGNNINLKGYVSTKNELGAWYDPVEFLNSK